jgi:hypothetical protein
MPRRSVVLGGVALVAASMYPSLAQAQAPEPYRDPSFECAVIDYGTRPPPVPGPPDDPLCVRYDKTNITLATLEVVDFLAAEPGRVAIVAARCSYWQQDHWVIRASPDSPPLVSWEGSYWYDAPSASAAGVLRDLRVADQPADAATFIDALRPIVGDAAAEELGAFADDGGGGGATFALPDGFGGDPCAEASGPPDDDGDPDTPSPVEGAEPPAEQPSDDARAGALPTTGSRSSAAIGVLLLVLAGAGRQLRRAVR